MAQLDEDQRPLVDRVLHDLDKIKQGALPCCLSYILLDWMAQEGVGRQHAIIRSSLPSSIRGRMLFQCMDRYYCNSKMVEHVTTYSSSQFL